MLFPQPNIRQMRNFAKFMLGAVKTKIGKPVRCLILISVLPASLPAQKLKVFISVDMEGIAGVVTDQQLGPTGFEYTRFREFMTAEAMAAILTAMPLDAPSGDIYARRVD